LEEVFQFLIFINEVNHCNNIFTREIFCTFLTVKVKRGSFGWGTAKKSTWGLANREDILFRKYTGKQKYPFIKTASRRFRYLLTPMIGRHVSHFLLSHNTVKEHKEGRTKKNYG
jgi:hypothetical protein